MRVHAAGVPLARIREALLDLFGPAQTLSVEATDAPDAPGGKLVQYRATCQVDCMGFPTMPLLEYNRVEEAWHAKGG